MSRKNHNAGNNNRNKNREQFEEYRFDFDKENCGLIRILDKFKAKTQAQADAYKIVNENLLTFLGGSAGTGKTIVAVAAAVEALNKGEVSKIVISRPVVESAKTLGFLPGGIAEKLAPYIAPILDNLEIFLGEQQVQKLMENGTIRIEPINYLRGRSLHNSFIILDEAQNSTREQMKLVLTRTGEKSKVVVTYDVNQVDLQNKNDSCINDMTRFFGHKNIGHFCFQNKDIVRSEICKLVLKVYDGEEYA